MISVGLEHGLDPWPKGLAGGSDELLRHVCPLSLNGGLQGINIWVGGCASLPLYGAPDPVVEGVAVR